jgi:hypothetical protein
MLSEIKRLLDQWLLRYRLQRSIRGAVRGFVAGLVLALFVAIWAVPRAGLTPSQFAVWAIGLVSSGLVLAGLGSYLWPIDRDLAVRSFDRRFQLLERISTALELSNSPETGNTLLAAQRQDALEHARQVDLRTRLPWQLPKSELAATLILILAIVGLTARNQPYFLAAMQKQALIKHIQDQAAGLEEIRSNLQKIENLTPEQREILKQPIDEAAQRLESAGTLEEALSALNQAEQEMRTLTSSELQDQANGLKNSGQRIGSQETSPLKKFGEASANGNFLQASQELESLDPAAMDSSQRGELADDLQAAADELAASNPELSQDLQQAGDALQSSDTTGAEQALDQAAQTLSDQAGDLTIASTASQIASELSASQQSLAQAGSVGQVQTNSSSQGNSGSQNGNSSQAGQNSSNGSASSGAGQGESQGNETAGGQAGAQPIDTANAPGDGGERTYESIYAPERLGDEAGQDLQLPGSGQPGEVIGQANQAPGTPNQSLTPYTEVYPMYESVVRQAIESGQIPQHLQALVRDYFSSLAP